MDDCAYQWPYTSMTQPRETGIDRLNALSALSAQVEALSRKLDVLATQRTQSVEVFCDNCAGNHPSHQCSISYVPVQFGGDYFNNYAYPSNYHQDWGYHPDDTWSYTHQDSYSAPSQMYPSEFSCPPPQQANSKLKDSLSKILAEREQEQANSRLEEFFSKLMASNNELIMQQEMSSRNLEYQMGQMFEALNSCPPNTWHYDMDSETDEVPEPNLQLDEPQQIEIEETSRDKENTAGEELYVHSNNDEPILLVPQVPSPPNFQNPVRFAKPCPLGSHVVGKALPDWRASTNEEPWWAVKEKIEEELIVFDTLPYTNLIINTMSQTPSYLTFTVGNLTSKSRLGDFDFPTITDGNLPNNALLLMDGGFLTYRRGIG